MNFGILEDKNDAIKREWGHMSKKGKHTIDYANFTLPEIIEKKTKREANFFELERNEQRQVLDFISDHNIGIKVLGYRWYDILSNKFFVIQYLPKEELSYGIAEEIHEFETFKDFFEFVHGDIYQKSCFYGFIFSDQDIRDYSIDLSRINFNSLERRTIDNCTLEGYCHIINGEAEHNAICSADITEWMADLKPISSLRVLETKYKQFVRRFDSWVAGKIFFSMIIRKKKITNKNILVEFICAHDAYLGLSFGTILLKLGRDAALEVIANFDGGCSYTTKRKRIGGFEDSLASYDDGSFMGYRDLGYDRSLQLYYVIDRFTNAKNCSIETEEYFTDFEEFISYVKGDLSDADLANAPLIRSEIKKYRFNENTKLPLTDQYDEHIIIKAFTGEKFVVVQKWFDPDGALILSRGQEFSRFFDFVYFLNGDLSGADLILCDGIENLSKIKGLKLDGIKVRSSAAEKLGLAVKLLPSDWPRATSFESIKNNELGTTECYMSDDLEDDDLMGSVSYITDLHLLHRFEAYKCKTIDDIEYVLKTIAKTLYAQSTKVNLIGGDTSSDFEVFKKFITTLASYNKYNDFFFVLGNHELWDSPSNSLYRSIEDYRSTINELGKGHMHLVHNNIFYFDREWMELSDEELLNISMENLRVKMRSARIIIFGGIGFAGMNPNFNANNDIYKDALNYEDEFTESARFLELYEKVTTALRGKNLIVLSHMPMKDWGGEGIHAKDGVIYVNGHTHRNFFYDDGKKRIYADNQVGYTGKSFSFKQIPVSFSYDWFADYEDGIFEISKEDYISFYRGILGNVTFNREYEKLFMIKRDETYMFLMRSPKGSLSILNGGAIRKAGNHPLEYFYENMVKYSQSVKLFLSNYEEYQKQISNEIKQIGGDGRIHGCIVDINFFNHVYINPLDGTITPYFAYSIVDKYVYDNLPSLLKYECPKLYANYLKMIDQKSDDHDLVLYNSNLPITKNRMRVFETDMYRISRILRGLQYTTRYNVVRLWNDAIVANATEENGKMIVMGIIDPESMPKSVA